MLDQSRPRSGLTTACRKQKHAFVQIFGPINGYSIRFHGWGWNDGNLLLKDHSTCDGNDVMWYLRAPTPSALQPYDLHGDKNC